MSRRQDDKNDTQKKERKVPVTRIEFVPVNNDPFGRTRAKHAPKFRDPANPFQTWSGYGPRPQWIRSYLAEGRVLDDFRITQEDTDDG